MFPIPNPITLFGQAVSSAAGWAWDKVTQGIYTWFANGLLSLMEWVWGVLDTATTPRLTEAWFATELVRPLAAIAVAVTVALMLASAIQAGFAGRPELIVDAMKEGPKAIVASALTVTVMDLLIRAADVLAEVVWQAGRDDARHVMDGLATTLSQAGSLAQTFLGPLALLFGMIGLLVTAVVLFMRSALLYVVAAFAPIVWSASVSPVLRGGGRRLVHVVVALVLAKPAIAVTLVVGVKLVANSGASNGGADVDGAAALGTLVSGFACFAIAGLSPWVVYRLLPSVEGASVSSGIVGGWGRSAMTAVQAGLMVKSIGAAGAASPATRALPTRGAPTAQTSSNSESAPASPPGDGNAASRPTRSAPSSPADGTVRTAKRPTQSRPPQQRLGGEDAGGDEQSSLFADDGEGSGP